jgi:tetratricopeptide (TPR) repeat protein
MKMSCGVALAMAAVMAACGGPSPTLVDEAPLPDMGTHWLMEADTVQAFLKGRVLRRSGDLDGAVAELEVAVSSSPADPELHAVLAETAAANGDVERTRLHSDLAVSMGAEQWRLTIAVARSLAESGSGEDALVVFNTQILESAPAEYFDTWFTLAESLNDSDGMMVAARAWLDAFPDRGESVRRMGLALLAAGERVQAADAFGAAGALPGGEPEDFHRQGWLHVEDGRYADARNAFDDCVERYRNDLACWVGLVVSVDHESSVEGDAISQEVAALLERLAGISGGDRYRFFAIRRALEMEARGELLVEFARAVATQRPFNTTLISNAAFAAAAGGDEDYAIALMERVLELDDSSFDALNFIGYALAERGERLEQAEVYVREALFLRPDSPHIEDSLAWIYYRQGRLSDAIAVQERVVEALPENAVILDHLGDMYEAAGRYEDAVAMWRRALQHAGPYDEDVEETAPEKIERALQVVGQAVSAL